MFAEAIAGILDNSALEPARETMQTFFSSSPRENPFQSRRWDHSLDDSFPMIASDMVYRIVSSHSECFPVVSTVMFE